MNLTPRELKIFVSLAGSLNFGQTAERFYVTQPTMSKMIRGLEDKLGVKLFERSTRSVSLTLEGRDLLEVASRVVDEFDMGVTELAEVARRRSQRLSIAALPSLAAIVLPQLVNHIRGEHPRAIIKIHDVINDTAMDLLRMRKVDFALSGLDVVHRDLSYTEIMREPFVLLASHDFPIRLDDTVWREEALEALPVISMPRGTGSRLCVDMAFMKQGRQFRPFLEIQGLSTIGKFVQRGSGIAILPRSAAQLVLDGALYIIALQGAPQRTIGVITRHESGLSDLAQKAIEWIRRHAPAATGAGGPPPG